MDKIVLGQHILLDLYDCDIKQLGDVDQIKAFMLEAAKIAEATIVGEFFHEFSPYGISGIVIIAESHISIHTWPERNFAAIDIFTCSDEMKYEDASQYLIKALKARKHEINNVKRGRF